MSDCLETTPRVTYGAEPTHDGDDCQLTLADSFSELSQPLTVSVVDNAALSSEDPQLCEVFSCLFCEHFVTGEVSLSLHLAEAHMCRSLFFCTECDYQCSVKELFAIHVTSHVSVSCEEVRSCGNDGKVAQAEVIIKQETREDPDGGQHNIMSGPDVSPVKTKIRKRNKNSASSKFTKYHSLDESMQQEELEKQANNEDTNISNTLPNLTLRRKDLNIDEDCSSKRSKSKFETFQELLKALRSTPRVILDVPEHSFSGCEKFSCFFCGYFTRRFQYFKDHFMKHFDLTPFVCEFCCASFVNKRRLQVHLNTVHAKERQFLCTYCPYAAKSLECLKKHELFKHPRDEDLKYECPDCLLKFALKQQLQLHQHLKHKLHKKFLCDLCNFSSNHLTTFQSHMNRHLGQTFLCPVCGIAYCSKYLLNRHLQTHNSANVFKCDHCPFSSNRRQGLRIHMRVHTNERPYQCSLCSYQAKSSGAVRVHMVKHYSERKFSCIQCDKTFKFKHHLERHLEQHSGMMMACHLCDYRAPSTASYQRHMLLHDPNRRRNCSLCERYFATPGELNHHMRKVHSVTDAWTALEN